MRKNALFIGVISLAIILDSCATITRGTTEALQIQTQPSGAIAKDLSTGQMCETPCVFVESRKKDDFAIKITKEGYKPVEVNVRSVISDAGAAGMAGNVLLGGIIGAGVDAVSGATNKLVPNPINVQLEKINKLNTKKQETINNKS